MRFPNSNGPVSPRRGRPSGTLSERIGARLRRRRLRQDYDPGHDHQPAQPRRWATDCHEGGAGGVLVSQASGFGRHAAGSGGRCPLVRRRAPYGVRQDPDVILVEGCAYRGNGPDGAKPRPRPAI